MNINWKVLTAQVSAVTGAFAAGGTLFGVIPGRAGLIVTAVAGGVNALLPRVQQAAGVLQSVRRYRADSKAQRDQKRQALVKGVVAEVVAHEVDALLKTQGFQRGPNGLVPLDAPADSIPNVAGTGNEVVAPQEEKPAVLQQPA